MKRLRILITAAALLVAILLVGSLNIRLLKARDSYDLAVSDVFDDSPPLVAFTTIALGGFRGILADILWVRAATLQDEGRFFEIVQLSDWITKLEPRFGAVWGYQAWNMAYNISALFGDPADRWRWIHHAISLLRDHGLEYNPQDAGLYRELGWVYQHKIGGYYDSFHLYYKKQLAKDMTELFGAGHPDFNNLSSTTLQRMKDIYHLDPILMREIDQRYGPFDWRLPHAHTVYWASQGIPYAGDYQRIALDRMIYQAMVSTFREGTLVYIPEENIYAPAPDIDALPHVIKAFKQAMQDNPHLESIRRAYAYFLQEVIFTLFLYEEKQEALILFEELSALYPDENTYANLDEFISECVVMQLQDLTPHQIQVMINENSAQASFWNSIGNTQRAQCMQKTAMLYTRYLQEE